MSDYSDIMSRLLRGQLFDFTPSQEEQDQKKAQVEEMRLQQEYAEKLRRQKMQADIDAAMARQLAAENDPNSQPVEIEAPLDMDPRDIEALRQAGVED